MAFVKPSITDTVVDSMKKAGATGATIIPARGTGMHEAKSFFGLSIEDKTDILVFLVEEHVVENLMKVIRLAGTPTNFVPCSLGGKSLIPSPLINNPASCT